MVLNRKISNMEDLLSYYCELLEVFYHGHSTIEALNNLTKYIPQKDKEFVWLLADNLKYSIEVLRKNRLVLDDGESGLFFSSSSSCSSTEELSDDKEE